MKKAYYKNFEAASKVLEQIQIKYNIFLCLQYNEKNKLYYIEY